MGAIGIDVVPETSSSSQNDELISFRVCGEDITRLMFLGIIGNFVSTTGNAELAPKSASRTLASVVVDVYTGELVVLHSFGALRTYFLETMLVVSILAIAKLGLIR
jgi:hypothetical protein